MCTPGDPTPEACNGLDDDCNGEVDDGADICGAGMVCTYGECLPGAAGAGGGGAGGSGSGGGGATTSSGSSCAIEPGGASPWGTLLLVSPLVAAFWRLRRRRLVIR
jgi:hypothetical protein